MKKSILLFFFLVGVQFASIAQIASVEYLIEYNETTGLYDCKIVILEGEAKSYLERVQFPTQYTVVVPTGSEVEIQELHNPLEFNQFYTGTIPCLWYSWQNEIAPPTQPENDFYSIGPNLSPVSWYNDLAAGDTITLFSVMVDVDPSEGSVRPFINGKDPSSLDMPSGGDYSNGFSIGSSSQLYHETESTWHCDNWEVSLADYELCSGECVELTADMNCTSADMIYAWGTGETTPTITVCPDQNTSYDLEVVSPDMDTLHVTNTISVIEGAEAVFTGQKTLCPLETTTLSPSSGGTWISDDPTVAIVSHSGVVTAISAGNAIFTFTNSLTGCKSKTAESLSVFDNPLVNFAGDSEICIGASTIVTSDTGGTWISDEDAIATIDNLGNVIGLSSGTASLIFIDVNTGCTSESLFVTVLAENDPSCLVNIDEIEAQNFKVYPNPAYDIVNIHGDYSIESITIFSKEYRKLQQQTFHDRANTRQVSIKDLTPGLYIIKINSRGKTLYEKLIVK